MGMSSPRLLFGISTAHHTDHAAVAEGGELSRLFG